MQNKYILLGKRTAIISFLIGTGIFSLYFLTSDFGLLFIGYGVLALIGLINLGIFIFILFKSNQDRLNRKKLLITCGLILLNIPIMLLYCWVTVILLNTMRVTFINKTSKELKDINIVGCEQKKIEKLMPNESKTFWIRINGDCSININYISNGQRKEENVAGYITNDMGQKINHNIGGKNNELYLY